jgi:hypothetical protein
MDVFVMDKQRTPQTPRQRRVVPGAWTIPYKKFLGVGDGRKILGRGSDILKACVATRQ